MDNTKKRLAENPTRTLIASKLVINGIKNEPMSRIIRIQIVKNPNRLNCEEADRLGKYPINSERTSTKEIKALVALLENNCVKIKIKNTSVKNLRIYKPHASQM